MRIILLLFLPTILDMMISVVAFIPSPSVRCPVRPNIRMLDEFGLFLNSTMKSNQTTGVATDDDTVFKKGEVEG